MASDLQTGSIDAAQGILPAQFPAVKDLPGITAIDYNYRNWDYLSFNCYDSPDSMGNPVLLDPKFRQALNYAIDREKLASVAFNGFADRRHHDHAAGQLDRPRLPLAAAGRPALLVRPGQGRTNCWTRPATRRAPTACGSTRASRSRCASGRSPTTCRSRRPAS